MGPFISSKMAAGGNKRKSAGWMTVEVPESGLQAKRAWNVSIRDGNFFGSGIKLELKQVVDLVYLYAYYEQASTASLNV